MALLRVLVSRVRVTNILALHVTSSPNLLPKEIPCPLPALQACAEGPVIPGSRAAPSPFPARLNHCAASALSSFLSAALPPGAGSRRLQRELLPPGHERERGRPRRSSLRQAGERNVQLCARFLPASWALAGALSSPAPPRARSRNCDPHRPSHPQPGIGCGILDLGVWVTKNIGGGIYSHSRLWLGSDDCLPPSPPQPPGFPDSDPCF